ncbi:DEAD/DEAH box helicase family protein [Streptomyces sp. GMY02]|uniref:DEAD/DEAH box helicase family protein n=1 Tax=Streptomyces sp. GMY02 TaxID=1333528 RepID=UPI002D807666|nr:DEAD/DEAH box helicase family protein [Streptomyces sp. GMY02]
MTRMELRPHQIEAVDSVLRFLSGPPGGGVPPEGLRTQVIAATGSGKTLIGTKSQTGSAPAGSWSRSRSWSPPWTCSSRRPAPSAGETGAARWWGCARCVPKRATASRTRPTPTNSPPGYEGWRP